MKELYCKPQIWMFLATGSDVIASSDTGGGGGFLPGPDPDFDPSKDDMEW